MDGAYMLDVFLLITYEDSESSLRTWYVLCRSQKVQLCAFQVYSAFERTVKAEETESSGRAGPD